MTGFRVVYDAGPEVDHKDILCLHRNENLFAGPEWTVDTAREIVAGSGIATYPDPTSHRLREALAELYNVSPDQIFVGNGSDEVLADLLALLRPRYHSLHVLDVGFKVYPFLAERMGYKLEILPGGTFETGHIDVNEFQGLAVIDSPNSITGVSLDRDELLNLASHNESFLIWDNVYGEYAGDTQPLPVRENLVFVRSFSKFYALAGLRVGYCIAGKHIVRALLDRKDPFNVNGFAQAMALEALRRQDLFNKFGEQVASSRKMLFEGLRELGFQAFPSSGIAILATHPLYSAEILQEELLKRNVAVRRFDDIAISNFIRITVPPVAGVHRCLEALGQITGNTSLQAS